MRYQQRGQASLPIPVVAHLIAVRYGQAPEDVLRWPADQFLLAQQLLAFTAPRGPA